MVEACTCGSGLPFLRCHGDPRNDFAREQALREAEVVATMFPRVRVRGIEELVESVPDEPDEWAAAADAVVARIPPEERRRVVGLWAEPYADRWESMTRTAADVDAVEHAFLRGAVLAAADERAEVRRELIEPLEDARAAPSPYPALAVMLSPQAVWSIDEARAAAAGARGRRDQLERFNVVEDVAFALMTFEHIARTRALAARFADSLPIADLPRASRLLEKTCADVDRQIDAARATTACLLIAYAEQLVSSEVSGVKLADS